MNRSVLAVTSELPWPLDTGGHLRTYHLLRGLTEGFNVSLVAGVAPDRREDVAAVEAAGIHVRAVTLPRRTRVTEAARALSAATAGEPYALYRRHGRPQIREAFETELASSRPDAMYLDHLDSF